MTMLACLVLLAASSRVELVDEVFQIPANEWRYVELGLKQRPAAVDADYEVRSGPPRVRMALVREGDLERMRRDRAHGVMAMTRPGPSGNIQYAVRRPDEYAIVVDNRDSSEAAGVHLRIWLDFAGRGSPEVTMLPLKRQFVVILVSFAVFFAIVTWSANRLLHVIRR
jgi:hypothetical protein